jgi:hypothetical protein
MEINRVCHTYYVNERKKFYVPKSYVTTTEIGHICNHPLQAPNAFFFLFHICLLDGWTSLSVFEDFCLLDLFSSV